MYRRGGMAPEYPLALRSLGDHVRTERLKRGLGQKEVADSIGIGISSVKKTGSESLGPSAAPLDFPAHKLLLDPLGGRFGDLDRYVSIARFQLWDLHPEIELKAEY